jgi:hypothetical protein
MKIKVALILLLSLIACSRQEVDDPETLKSILSNYFEGIKTQDLQKLNSLTTSDFVLFENGKIWTNDSIASIKHKFKLFTGVWRLENMRVNIDQSSGDIVYFNHGELIFNDTLKMNFDWLESATFRKVDGEWKMNFLHSTIRK